MRKHVWWILLFFNPCIFGLAVNNLRMADVRSIGMGGNEAISSALFNPSLIALYANNRIGINYFNRYALKELSTFSGSFYFPNPMLSFGADISTFGYEAYRESQVRFLLAKRLNEQWTLGVSFQYAFVETELFEDKTGQLSTDIGASFAPVDNLLMGLLIMNLPAIQLGDKSVVIKDFKAYLIQIGINWEVINHVFVSCALESNNEQAVTGAGGIEYQPFIDFSVRAGIKGNPLLPSFGVGYRLGLFTIDAAVAYHAVLGISSGIGLQFTF